MPDCYQKFLHISLCTDDGHCPTLVMNGTSNSTQSPDGKVVWPLDSTSYHCMGAEEK